jgi:hypothetical protein
MAHDYGFAFFVFGVLLPIIAVVYFAPGYYPKTPFLIKIYILLGWVTLVFSPVIATMLYGDAEGTIHQQLYRTMATMSAALMGGSWIILGKIFKNASKQAAPAPRVLTEEEQLAKAKHMRNAWVAFIGMFIFFVFIILASMTPIAPFIYSLL